MKAFSLAVLSATLLSLSAAGASWGEDIDWKKAGSEEVTLIYPGVASWEFLLSDNHRLGSRAITKRTKDCRHCHLSKEGELDLRADEIASGTIRMKRAQQPFEPEPVPGKPGVMKARLQAAYDKDYLYVRVEWGSKGRGWKEGKIPDRVSLQVNRLEPSFGKYGCFITCHNDLATMPGSPSKKEVRSNSYYGALDREDVRLYAYYARDSWREPKTKDLLEKKLKTGLIDLWSMELSSGESKPQDGWILEDRRWEEENDLKGSSARWENGKYVAVFKRSFGAKGTHDISFKEGDTVTFGLAIHEDGVEKRRHYVSFPFTIGVGTAGNVKAVKVGVR